MGVLAWVGRETQDFASHKGVYAAIASGLLDGCIGIGRTGDAKFCVSQGGYAAIVSGLLNGCIGMGWT